MFLKCLHILVPLADQVSKNKINWTPECQKAFDSIKVLLAKDAFLKYPDHNRPFHIYCDASDLQLGAVIMQDNAPVAYYSCKLNSAQKKLHNGRKRTFVHHQNSQRVLVHAFWKQRTTCLYRS
jgi:hypothetical protein